MLTHWQRDSGGSEYLRLMMANSDTLRLPEPIAEGFRFRPEPVMRVNPGFRAYLDKKYHKVVMVVDFIAASGAVGPEEVVRTCEVFATGSARQWLKVAGDVKAEVVDYMLQARAARDRCVIAEFGSFVGYTCTRMAWRSSGETRVMSLESDAIHVMVARHVTSVARCSAIVDLCPGMAHDSVRRLADDWGDAGVTMAFMDHRGTRFHVELNHLEALRVPVPEMGFLADNTLKPGAPVNLWHFDHCPRHSASINWSLPEFVSEECEDWMSADILR